MTGVFEMVRAKIIGKPGLRGDNVVGTIRYLAEDGRILGEYPFEEKLVDIVDMSTEEFEAHAIKTMRAKLKASRLESNWSKTQEILGPLVIPEEEEA